MAVCPVCLGVKVLADTVETDGGEIVDEFETCETCNGTGEV